MMNILKLDVNVKKEDNGISVRFIGGVGRKFSEMITEKEEEKIVNLITEITEVANDAIGRELDKIKKEAIEEVAPGLSEKIKKIEEKIDKIESPEDLLDLLKEML